jgi:molybdopterin converting factor subunit 1
MKIKVLFFASFREIVGSSSLNMTVDDSCTTLTLFETLCEMHPQLKLGADQVSVAVNKNYVSSTLSLKDGDEVAFLPPISGG